MQIEIVAGKYTDKQTNILKDDIHTDRQTYIQRHIDRQIDGQI